MIKIKNENVVQAGHQFDYELENGVLLHESEWNGEVYTVKRNGIETTYRPVYFFELAGINIEELEENSDEWLEAIKIVGFD